MQHHQPQALDSWIQNNIHPLSKSQSFDEVTFRKIKAICQADPLQVTPNIAIPGPIQQSSENLANASEKVFYESANVSDIVYTNQFNHLKVLSFVFESKEWSNAQKFYEAVLSSCPEMIKHKTEKQIKTWFYGIKTKSKKTTTEKRQKNLPEKKKETGPNGIDWDVIFTDILSTNDCTSFKVFHQALCKKYIDVDTLKTKKQLSYWFNKNRSLSKAVDQNAVSNDPPAQVPQAPIELVQSSLPEQTIKIPKILLKRTVAEQSPVAKSPSVVYSQSNAVLDTFFEETLFAKGDGVVP